MTLTQRRRRLVGLLLPLGAILAVVLASPAAATPPYATWTPAVALPPAVGFPGAGLSYSDPAPVITTPSGASTFLAPNTDFGAEYGASQDQPYLNVATALNSPARSVTLTFTEPTPAAGWGFALGDLDSETIQVTATGVGGAAVSGAELGLVSTFNFCAAGISPRAPACAGQVRADVSGTVVGPTSVITSGNPGDPTAVPPVPVGTNTIGSTAWFQPSVSLVTLTLTLDDIAGSPLFHLWIAALTATASGTVTAEDPQGEPTPVPGATVTVVDDTGTPIQEDPTDPASPPVTTTTDDSGAFAVSGLFVGDGADYSGSYGLVVTPPADQPTLQPVTIPVDVSAGDVAGLTAALPGEVVAPPAPPPAPEPGPSPVPGPAPVPAPAPPAPQLAATGPGIEAPLAVAVALLGSGMAACVAARRRRA